MNTIEAEPTDSPPPGPDPGPTDGGTSWWDPLGVVDRCGSGWRAVEKQLARQPFARVTTAVPRTARWVTDNVRHRAEETLPGVPRARMTAAMIGHVAMDESIMAMAVGPNRYPSRSDYQRVGRELADARDMMEANGWIADPVSYHRTPPPVTRPATSTGWALGRAYDRLWWPSGYDPPEGMPGRERWLDFEANRTASAWTLQHHDRPRPWVVCIHGFGTGSVFMDLFSFRAGHLHDALGLNVAAIVLPVHGSRKPSRISGEEFLNFDLMNAVHGLSQAVWDIRSLLGWIRAQDAPGVGLFGVSLGGYLTALVSALEADLDMALAGIPVADFIDMFRHHSPHHVHMRAVEHHILDGTAEDVHRVVSPLAMPTVVPKEARAIFAGLGDRLAPPEQAHRLWRHWDEPETCWFPGNHVGYLWSDKAWRFVDRACEERGLVA
jgi:hypothetical protein